MSSYPIHQDFFSGQFRVFQVSTLLDEDLYCHSLTSLNGIFLKPDVSQHTLCKIEQRKVVSVRRTIFNSLKVHQF